MMDRPIVTTSPARRAHSTRITSVDGSTDAGKLFGRKLVREMRQRWSAGQQPMAEEFLLRHPELHERPEDAVDLIYEEYCQRQAAGEQDVEEAILRRFGQWAGPLRVMFDCHQRLLELDEDRPQFPLPGECLGEFRLISELARGSRGRVFLATQMALADRPVVLKISPLDGAEHLSLARLQHTNIVPLYSVVDDTGRRIRILCMPYFGRTTLALLLESLADVPLCQRSGRHIVAAMNLTQEASTPPMDSAARQMLASVSYPQAMCWIVASLAEALQFAHERGIVHLDLKPSNVLLANDGQPMLLDFHLAREPIRPGGPLPLNFGGTRPYMPPEQQRAMHSLSDGKPIDAAVDGRADVFALGAMLYESLGGTLPLTDGSPPLWQINSQVSVGLSDIVAKCVAGGPEDRYAMAGALAEDLRRHLTDRSLACAPNRSFTERWNKWRRRHPGKLRMVAMIGLIITAAAALLAGKWSHLQERRQQAELALRDGSRQLKSEQATEAAATLERGLALAKDLPMQRGLERDLRDQLTAARRLQLGQQIHRLAEEVRVLYGADSIAAGRLRALRSQCSAFWEKRQTVLDALGAARNADLDCDLMDIAIFAADVRVLDEAEAMFGPSPVFYYERRALSSPTASPISVTLPARASGWEHYALGRALLRCGDLEPAMRELKRARELDPAGRWANFYYGLGAYRMGHHQEAVAAFSVCIGNSPHVAGYFYNRAMAYAALHQSDSALADCDRALEIDPTFDPARQFHAELERKAGK